MWCQAYASGIGSLPLQVAAVDTNGAGDTFATAYMLALARHARNPGADANWVASRAVMHAQACKPQCVLEGIVLGSSYAQYRQWLRGQVTLLLVFSAWLPRHDVALH